MNIKKIYEDAVVAAGAGDGGIVPNTGLTDTGVLGHCDHQKDGYMGDGCFHIPANALHKGVMKRYEIPSKKKKNQKNPYVKDAKILNDAEFDRKTIMSLHKLDEADIANWVSTNFNIDVYDLYSIAYFPVTKTFFIKFKDKTNKFKYVNADLENGILTMTNDKKTYSTSEMIEKYREILNMPENNPNNVESAKINLWIVWGRR